MGRSLSENRLGLCYRYDPHFCASALADRWFEELRETVPWTQPQVRVYGRWHRTPRLTAWVAEGARSYMYSGVEHPSAPWTPTLEAVREEVERASSHRFNSVLLNLYRSGADSVGWHSDDEAVLGDRPVIGSLSLGAPRRFRFRPHAKFGPPLTALPDAQRPRCELLLEHGSLLVMEGETQRRWQHCLPRGRASQSRINLTFRWLHE
ncbi:MAG: alpha-ketoglutarate-dependent dioxygenase AlkB [Pseudomonadota bacterium]